MTSVSCDSYCEGECGYVVCAKLKLQPQRREAMYCAVLLNPAKLKIKSLSFGILYCIKPEASYYGLRSTAGKLTLAVFIQVASRQFGRLFCGSVCGRTDGGKNKCTLRGGKLASQNRPPICCIEGYTYFHLHCNLKTRRQCAGHCVRWG